MRKEKVKYTPGNWYVKNGHLIYSDDKLIGYGMVEDVGLDEAGENALLFASAKMLQEQRDQLYEALKAVEWGGAGVQIDEDGPNWPSCPSCGQIKGTRHSPACIINKGLNAVEGK